MRTYEIIPNQTMQRQNMQYTEWEKTYTFNTWLRLSWVYGFHGPSSPVVYLHFPFSGNSLKASGLNIFVQTLGTSQFNVLLLHNPLCRMLC